MKTPTATKGMAVQGTPVEKNPIGGGLPNPGRGSSGLTASPISDSTVKKGNVPIPQEGSVNIEALPKGQAVPSTREMSGKGKPAPKD